MSGILKTSLSSTSSLRVLAVEVLVGRFAKLSSGWPQEAQNLEVAEAEGVPQSEQYLVAMYNTNAITLN
jgi:hypothetical protein